METLNFLKILKKRQGVVITFVLIFIGLALIATFSQPLKYRASSRLLIIQEGTTADSYAIAKSNQYLSSLLSEAIASGSFFDLMNSADSNIDWNYFNGDYKNQIKKWKKTVVPQSANDTGVMSIDVYHPNPEQARQIALAVNNVVMSQNNIYQGSNNNVKIKVIDQPIVSSFPVKPNLPLNFGASLIFGLLFGLTYIYYFPVGKKEKRRAMLKNIRQEQVRTLNRNRLQEQAIESLVQHNNFYQPAPTNIPVMVNTLRSDENTLRNPESDDETKIERPTFQGNMHNIIN